MAAPSRLYKNGTYICVWSPEGMGTLLLCQTCTVVTSSSVSIPVIWLKQSNTAGKFIPSLKFNILVATIVGEVTVTKRENDLIELDQTEMERLYKLVSEVKGKLQEQTRNKSVETIIGVAKVTDKTSFFVNTMREVYKSSALYSDLVLLCADNEQVCVHQSIMTTLSPIVREVLMDQKFNDNIAYISLDQNSDTVKKVVEIVYTGKANVDNTQLKSSVQELLKCLGLNITIVSNTSVDIMVAEEVEEVKEEPCNQNNNDDPLLVFNGNNNDESDIMYNGKESLSCEMSVGTEDSQIKDAASDEEDVVSKSRPSFDGTVLRRSLRAYVQMRPSDVVGKVSLIPCKRNRESESDRGCDSFERSAKFQSLSCQGCSKSFKQKMKLISHQVDDHYYEDLENLLVGEFLEFKVCCLKDFSKSGFDAFIRHKALFHGALDLVMFKEVEISSR